MKFLIFFLIKIFNKIIFLLEEIFKKMSVIKMIFLKFFFYFIKNKSSLLTMLFIIFFFIHFLFNVDFRDIMIPVFENILEFVAKVNRYTFLSYFDISHFWNEFKKEFDLLPKVVVEPYKPPEPPYMPHLPPFLRAIVWEIHIRWYHWVEYPISIRWYRWVERPIRITDDDTMLSIVWKTWKAHGPALMGLTMAGLAYYAIFWE